MSEEIGDGSAKVDLVGRHEDSDYFRGVVGARLGQAREGGVGGGWREVQGG
jgi:hypothetical protein